MHRNGQNSTSGQIFTLNMKSPWALSYSTTNFGGAYYKIYACFERKTAFVMQNFRNLGASGDGGDHFCRNPQKAHPCLISRVLSHYAWKSVRGFLLQLCPRKKGTLQKVTERLYFTYLWGIPHATKFNRNWHMGRGRRRNRAYQVWWRSIQGLQSYGRSNFGLLHRNGSSPITLWFVVSITVSIFVEFLCTRWWVVVKKYV